VSHLSLHCFLGHLVFNRTENGTVLPESGIEFRSSLSAEELERSRPHNLVGIVRRRWLALDFKRRDARSHSRLKAVASGTRREEARKGCKDMAAFQLASASASA
jgi:hypothetical protein